MGGRAAITQHITWVYASLSNEWQLSWYAQTSEICPRIRDCIHAHLGGRLVGGGGGVGGRAHGYQAWRTLEMQHVRIDGHVFVRGIVFTVGTGITGDTVHQVSTLCVTHVEAVHHLVMVHGN